MKNMTADQIRTRLAEIKAQQATHEARNFDAELLTLMQSGGDVDVLEGQQLEAERVTRRLRVEAQALKAMLPEAVRTEVRTAIERLAEESKPDHAEMVKHIDELIALDKKRFELYSAIGMVSDRQVEAMDKARALTGLGRSGTHGEAQGDEAIISMELANEMLSLMPTSTIEFEQIPEQTRAPLMQHLMARHLEREHARHVSTMQQIAAERTASQR
nr:hypothetical protein [Alcaligenes faecalis]